MSRYADAVALLASRQKTAAGAPAWSRFVNRPLGRRLAALAFVLGRTPDQVTAASALSSYAAIALLALAEPRTATGVAVAALLVLGYALDSADGQLARLRGGGSPAGEWLDHVVDAAKLPLLHLAVLLSLRRGGADDVVLLLPLGWVVVSTVFFSTILLTDLLRRLHGTAGANAARRAPVLRSLLVLPTDYGVLCLVPLLLGTPLFAPVYGALLLGTALFLAAALPSWRAEMQRLSGPPGPPAAR